MLKPVLYFASDNVCFEDVVSKLVFDRKVLFKSWRVAILVTKDSLKLNTGMVAADLSPSFVVD